GLHGACREGQAGSPGDLRRRDGDQGMIRMYLIRHGSTPGNREHRYIGRTEEDLCEEGILALKGQEAPEVQRIYASPMRRCIQTAKILYPGRPPVKIEEFRECDFGRFEGKNYQELSGDPG